MNIAENDFALPQSMQGDNMTAKLNRAKAFNTLATEGELIRLEALCRISDCLCAVALNHLLDDKDDSDGQHDRPTA
ncbi:hypothetical protein [Bifidobacterium vansinderenii]|uniref:Uncharacterized protein n=1 Tax=Bifidobacterium vansinderenii TaxID=1984871 RepID=A0A229VYV9_9BIFI|nr:hypothetical protein [Bifidobacterium vansinderenii]OXN00795.1 hypothetical protein Tam10B_0750 [Bifidobacterium vansinderenii]